MKNDPKNNGSVKKLKKFRTKQNLLKLRICIEKRKVRGRKSRENAIEIRKSSNLSKIHVKTENFDKKRMKLYLICTWSTSVWRPFCFAIKSKRKAIEVVFIGVICDNRNYCCCCFLNYFLSISESQKHNNKLQLVLIEKMLLAK